MRLKRIVLGLLTLAGVAFAVVPSAVSAHQSHSKNGSGSSVPHYQHIVEIMMENTSYGTIIGNYQKLVMLATSTAVLVTSAKP